MGYIRSGFDVTGIDIVKQPDYPGTFIQADALEYLNQYGSDYDLIHASPPCQSSTALTKGTNQGKFKYADLIAETQEALKEFSVPTIIENVEGSPIRKDFYLCGEMFGLKVIRHRYFEVNFEFAQPIHPKHKGRVKGWRHGQVYEGYYYAVYGKGGYKGTVSEWQDAMDIHWTKKRKSIAEAVPPAYTEYIGKYLQTTL